MDVDLISKLFICPIFIIALTTIYLIGPIIGIQPSKHRYSSIDGLRAFLAMFVFLHHSGIWLYVPHIHKWGAEPSDLFIHFGPTSVAFFFMITAFLFFSKLIDSYSKNLDWTKLYVSRIMRIMPLYIGSIFIMILIIGLTSHFTMKENFQDLFWHILQWILFMEPDINKIQGTRYINSGIQWSLAYEWAFYCSLAIIGWLFFRIRTSLITILLTIFFLIFFLFIIDKYYSSQEWKRMAPFLAGLVTAFIARNEKVRKFSSKKLISPILISLLVVVFVHYPTVFEPVPYSCVTIVFIAIACGNTFFGLLTSKPFLLLGEISYSIYLLHGFVLFIAFYFIIGFKEAKKLSVLSYWEIICLCTIVVVVVSGLSYYFLEKKVKARGTTGIKTHLPI